MEFLKVSASPHIKSLETTKFIMLDVIIALIPALAWSIYVFGFRAITLTAITVASCVIFEFLIRLLLKKSTTIGDLSSVVTGILLAMSLPVSVPLWLPIIGSFFAIVIVKQLFGGLGKNVVNPALAARVFLFAAFPSELVFYTKVGGKLSAFAVAVENSAIDIKASATPLVALKNSTLPTDSLLDLFMGNIAGCIGEVSAFLLILGGLYLLFKKVITWHIPFFYIGTVAVLTFVFSRTHAFDINFTLAEILSGGLIMGAFFMATDYVTSPATNFGRVIYAVGCGAITVFIRYFGGYPEGVSFAIMIMNLFVWYLDKFTRPTIFGGKCNEK